MRQKLMLTILSVAITGCPLVANPVAVPVDYVKAGAGVCAGVELTVYQGGIENVFLDRSASGGKNEGVFTPQGVPVRLPDPDPGTSRYYLAKSNNSGAVTVALDLAWRCLPDKRPFRVQLNGSETRGLKITENPASPYGFDVVVQDIPR